MVNVVRKLDRYFGKWSYYVLRKPEKKDGGRSGARWVVRRDDDLSITLRYLKSQNRMGRHILMKPDNDESFFLCDDLSWDGIESFHMQNGHYKKGRLVIETSPGNYQVWVSCSRPLSVDEKVYWLSRIGSDRGCHPEGRTGRAPGYRNVKDKYLEDGRYPLSKLVWVDWRYTVSPPKIDVPKRAPRVCKPLFFSRRAGVDTAVDTSTIRRFMYDKGDESATDFAFALALLRRGENVGNVMARIADERTDWSNHQGEVAMKKYLKRSVARAASLISG